MPENNPNTEVNEEKKQLTAEVAATAADTASDTASDTVADTAALPHDKAATDKRAAVKEAVFKYVAMALLIGSFIYFTVYGFLSNPFLESGTASEIGLKYPTAFKFWGFTTSLALTVNLVYTYTHKGFKYRQVKIAGYVLMGLGVACLMTCVHIPSTRVPGIQMYAHWATALLFALFFAAAIIIHLAFPDKPNKKYKIALMCFGGLLLAIVIALLAAGKNGFIESLPMWMAYVIVFLDNFTPALKDK